MNRFQQWVVRLAARIAPPLGRVLTSAGGTVERLEAKNQMLEVMLADRNELIQREQEDYREAIALAGGGWIGRNKESGQFDLRPRESDSTAVVKCKEYLAELELALEDRGWRREQAYAAMEFSRYGIQQIILMSRLYYIKNPLVRRGVDVSSVYVFGRGVEISSPDDAANEVLQAFWKDERNLPEVSHTGLTQKEQTLFTDGNLFWALFTDPADGATVIRSIDATEIDEIICDPNDAAVPRYYHRRWMEQDFDMSSGVVQQVSRNEWYLALDYEPKPGETTIQGKRLMTDDRGEFVRVLHWAEGGLPKWHFGCPRVYPAIDWARAYQAFLRDWASITRALARFSWMVETKGGAPAIAAFKQTLATTLGNGGDMWEQNPPPTVGSAFVTGPGNKLTPVGTKGQTTEPEQGRRVLLMVAAAFGLPETFFGDTTTGSLATATSLDRPTELMFLERQEGWRERLQKVSRYVLGRSKTAPKGRLREAAADAQEIVVEVKFPSILEHDITSRVTAIVEALTINGFEMTGIDEKTGIGLLLSELGVEDVEAVLDAMYPEGTYTASKAARKQQQQDDALALQVKQQALKPPNPVAGVPPLPEPAGARTASAKRQGLAGKKESRVLEAAIMELTKAARKLRLNGAA